MAVSIPGGGGPSPWGAGRPVSPESRRGVRPEGGSGWVGGVPWGGGRGLVKGEPWGKKFSFGTGYRLGFGSPSCRRHSLNQKALSQAD